MMAALLKCLQSEAVSYFANNCVSMYVCIYIINKGKCNFLTEQI